MDVFDKIEDKHIHIVKGKRIQQSFNYVLSNFEFDYLKIGLS